MSDERLETRGYRLENHRLPPIPVDFGLQKRRIYNEGIRVGGELRTKIGNPERETAHASILNTLQLFSPSLTPILTVILTLVLRTF